MVDIHEHTDGCGHDHEHDHEHEMQYMTLMLEDNTEVRCMVLGIFEVDDYEGKEYIALLSEDGEDSFVYEYVETDENEDGFELLNIDSDEEFETVVSAIDEILEDDEEYEDYEYDYEEEDEE